MVKPRHHLAETEGKIGRQLLMLHIAKETVNGKIGPRIVISRSNAGHYPPLVFFRP